jgi:nucleoside-diphosphate-sugar epimerase
MVATISEAVGKPGRSRHMPLWPFNVAASVCEAVLPPLGITPPLHSRRLDFFRKSFRFSTERARQLLGFQPQVQFAEGAQRTASWYRDAGLLG